MSMSAAFGIPGVGPGAARLGAGDEYVLDWLAGDSDVGTVIIAATAPWESGACIALVRAVQAAGLRAYLETVEADRLDQAIALGAQGVAIVDGDSYVLHEPGRESGPRKLAIDVPSIARAAVAARLQSRRLTGTRLPADLAFDGRTQLVLLPGMLADASAWDAVAGDLLDAATIRVARIDLADSITGLAELVLAEAPAQFALAGHSLGAIVALAVARMAPERVTRLALLNASGRAPSDEQRANWSALADRVEAGEFLEVAHELALRNLPDFRRADGPLVSGSTRMAASIGSGGLLRQLAAQQSRGDLLPSLADVRVPTLVVSGERDDVSPVEWQRELARGIPGAHYRILPDTGHLSPCENPAGVASLLREWLGS